MKVLIWERNLFLCHILVLKVEFKGLQCVTSQISESRRSEVVGLHDVGGEHCGFAVCLGGVGGEHCGFAVCLGGVGGEHCGFAVCLGGVGGEHCGFAVCLGGVGGEHCGAAWR